jgi:hypothetical protein
VGVGCLCDGMGEGIGRCVGRWHPKNNPTNPFSSLGCSLFIPIPLAAIAVLSHGRRSPQAGGGYYTYVPFRWSCFFATPCFLVAFAKLDGGTFPIRRRNVAH